MRFGILHPGSMGVSIAAAAKNSGHQVYWASEGRSEQSRRRADEQGLIDGGSLEDLCRDCTVIVCVCPPHAALDVASQVAACGYTGLYVDANAIAPDKAQEVGRMVEGAGA